MGKCIQGGCETIQGGRAYPASAFLRRSFLLAFFAFFSSCVSPSSSSPHATLSECDPRFPPVKASLMRCRRFWNQIWTERDGMSSSAARASRRSLLGSSHASNSSCNRAGRTDGKG